MKFLLIHLLSVLMSICFILALIQRSEGKQQNSNRLEKNEDYLDVPVRAGYRIMDNDNDGYLEDGIIVKTKGTGYIDPRYRKKYYRKLQPSSTETTRFTESRRRYDFYPLTSSVSASASSHFPRYYYPKKPFKSEIIYGRREW